MIAGLVILAIILLIAYIALAASVNILFGLIVPLLIWAVIGWLAGQIMRGSGYGAIGNILLGIVGGIVGSIVFRILGLGVSDMWFVGNIIVGVVGSIIVIAVGRMLSGRSVT